MKKVFGIIAVIALLITSVATAVIAVAEDSAQVTFTLSSIDKQADEVIAKGTTFDITVSVNEIPVIYMVEYKFCYNKTLMKPVAMNKGGFLAAMAMADVTEPLSPELGESDVNGEIWVTGMNLDALSSSQDEVIATITFEALEDIKATSRVYCIGEPLASGDINCVELYTTTFKDGGIMFEGGQTETTTPTEPAVDGKVTLLPPQASDFTCVPGGDGQISVSKVGEGYKFATDIGWPNAWYMPADQEYWITVDVNDPEAKLYWDFTVSNAANVLVFFAGQNPGDQAAPGTFRSINTIIDPSLVNANGDILDLPAGTYKGSIHVSELGCADTFITDGQFTISGMKVFAVGGAVMVNELSAVGESAATKVTDPDVTDPTDSDVTDPTDSDVTDPTDSDVTDPTQGATTVTALTQGTTTVTESTQATTTTVARQDTPKSDSPNTGDTSDALLVVSIASLAMAFVLASVMMKKYANTSF